MANRFVDTPVSVCIPTYGRIDAVYDTVFQLSSMVRRGDEIIVIDQNTPPLMEQSESLRRMFVDSSIRLIIVDVPNLPAARNIAVMASINDLIVFIDDDVCMPRNFLDEHRAAHADQSVAAVGGSWLEKGDREESDAYAAIQSGLVIEIGRDLKGKLTGRNFSVKKEAYLAVGGFDEQFLGSANYEDSDFCQRLIISNNRVVSSRRTWLLHLRASSGGCRIASRTRPEWQNSLGFFIYAFRHGQRTGEFWRVIWEGLRSGPLRKYNVVRTWRQPKAWAGIFHALIVGIRCAHRPPNGPLSISALNVDNMRLFSLSDNIK